MQKSITTVVDKVDLANIKTYEAGVIQSTAFRVINKVTTNLLKEYNLTTMQWFIVGTIYETGAKGMTVTDLAKKLDTGISFMTNSINVLETKDMVARKESAKDSRVRVIHIKPAFKAECAEIEQKLREKLRKTLYIHITREELSVYIKVLHQLAAL